MSLLETVITFTFLYIVAFLKGHFYSRVDKTHSGHVFPLVHINVTLNTHVTVWHSFIVAASTFLFAQVVILIKDEWGGLQRSVYDSEVCLAKCHNFFLALVLMDSDKDGSISVSMRSEK